VLHTSAIRAFHYIPSAKQDAKACGNGRIVRDGYNLAKECRSCRFSVEVSSPGRYHCHRRAPQVYGQHGNTRWPCVLGSEWCGEFVPKAEKPLEDGVYRSAEPPSAIDEANQQVNDEMKSLTSPLSFFSRYSP
jgi:hypothetical protein